MDLELSQDSFDKIRDYVVSNRQKEAVSYIRNEYKLSENAALYVLSTVSNMSGAAAVLVPPSPTPPLTPLAPEVKKDVDWSLIDNIFFKKNLKRSGLSKLYGVLFGVIALALVFVICGCTVAILPYSLTFDSLNANTYNNSVKVSFYLGGLFGVGVVYYIYRNEYFLSYKQDHYESRWYDIVPVVYALVLPSRVLFLQLESFFFFMVAILFSVASAYGLMRSKRLKPMAKVWLSVLVTSVMTAVGSGLLIGVRVPPGHQIIAKKQKIAEESKTSSMDRSLEIFQNRNSSFSEKKKAAKVLAGHMNRVRSQISKFEYLLLSSPTFYKWDDVQVFSDENWHEIEFLSKWNGLEAHGFSSNWVGISPHMFKKMIEINPQKTYNLMKKDSQISYRKAKYWKSAYAKTYIPGAMLPLIQSDDFSDIELALKNKGKSIDKDSLYLWENLDWKSKFPEQWKVKHSDFLKSTIKFGKQRLGWVE